MNDLEAAESLQDVTDNNAREITADQFLSHIFEVCVHYDLNLKYMDIFLNY